MPCLGVMQVKRIDYYQRTDQALSQFLSGASAHSLSTDVTTYLHGDGLLTLRVARLPEGQELPGADTDQVWFWLRPRQVGGMALGSVTQPGTYAWMHKDPQQDFSSAAVPLTMRSSLQKVPTRPGGGYLSGLLCVSAWTPCIIKGCEGHLLSKICSLKI